MPIRRIRLGRQLGPLGPGLRQRRAPPGGKAHGPPHGGGHQPRAARRGNALSVRGAQPLYRKNHAMFPR